MKKLTQKLRNRKGFTLMEMLIVVAIIAILVAVAIPTFGSQLNKAKKATDLANQRAAKAVAATKYLTDDAAANGGNYIFDAVSGTLSDSAVSKGYGKCSDHTGDTLRVSITANGEIYMTWVAAGQGPAPVSANEGLDTEP